MSRPPSAKGVVSFGKYKTWYRVTGDLTSGRPPVVVLHGGPGSTHDYLLALTELADAGWPVIHYDQIGNGGSTHLPDRGKDFWTVQLFKDELENLLDTLNVADDYILFGQSWGGILGASHAAERPAGLRGLVIANSPASYVLWLQEMEVLRAALPADIQETLRHHEAAGTTDNEEYFAAMRVFYDRHVCRVVPWPRDFVASFMEIYDDPTVYYTMNGPNEFHVVGTLKDWSVEDELDRIKVPTLLITGRHDEATPATVQPYFDRIPEVRWEILEDSSHLPHLEEPERFKEILLGYLEGLLPGAGLPPGDEIPPGGRG
ncbi:proline iminopeptidase-family hydrolase [Streptomyces sp. CB01881]|uniref:proline iminopeptidase-family hydrolase n=1 Tax=Streptomyces sp. CB01881 TaxID=2078691 RepID=UPI000CDCAB29|nr:proline iminopeptidase-family hydrolase [Streptomyces sp. CB01881]AUY50400.1 alpha/beta hydrolase [Streptomyces sp. CB01881]TYC73788.1 alpha/beta fold hydrolase [Streptomyces sp. CB01881]